MKYCFLYAHLCITYIICWKSWCCFKDPHLPTSKYTIGVFLIVSRVSSPSRGPESSTCGDGEATYSCSRWAHASHLATCCSWWRFREPRFWLGCLQKVGICFFHQKSHDQSTCSQQAPVFTLSVINVILLGFRYFAFLSFESYNILLSIPKA